MYATFHFSIHLLVECIYSLFHAPLTGQAFPRSGPGGSVVKNPPAMQETQKMQVRSLDWEDPLEKEMATHSSILAWEIPWTEEPGRLLSTGSQNTGHD